MCQISDVEKLREAYKTEGEVLVLFRFAVTDYFAETGYVYIASGEDKGLHYDQAYMAQESVFLNFDIIQLTFNDSGDMTVIPVVSYPIDIIDPITPPTDFSNEDYWKLVWWLLGIMVGSVVVGILGTMAQKMSEKKGG